MFSEIFDMFLDEELLIILTGGDVFILDEFTASDFSDAIFRNFRSIL